MKDDDVIIEELLRLAEQWRKMGLAYKEDGNRHKVLECMFEGYRCTQEARKYLK